MMKTDITLEYQDRMLIIDAKFYNKISIVEYKLNIFQIFLMQILQYLFCLFLYY